MKSWLMCLSLSLCLLGCATQPRQTTMSIPQGNAELFAADQTIAIPEPSSFYQLTDADKQQYIAFIEQPEVRQLAKFEQLSLYLNQLMHDFNYEGENLNATTALQRKTGNCMTLAMVTYALAKEFDVNIAFRTVDSLPMLLNVDDSLAMYSSHVRSLLTGKRTSSDTVGVVWIDYFPESSELVDGVDVDEATFLAMFYRNLASDALLAGQANHAYHLAMRGLQLAPHYPALINFVAVLHSRAGDYQTATAFYEYGLVFAPKNVDLLANYAITAQHLHDDTKVQQLTKMIDELEDIRAIDQYLAAMDAMREGRYRIAQQQIQQFLTSYPYFHRAYLLLAQCQVKLGDIAAAEHALGEAARYAGNNSNKQLYYAKLSWLQMERSKL